MDEGREAYLQRVSYHAVTRYAQRVLGAPNIANGSIGTEPCAAAHCAALGLTIEQVRHMILTPAVLVALKLGASQVKGNGYVAIIKPSHDDGQVGRFFVATIYEELHARRIPILTRSEGQKTGRRSRIANKRRPAPARRLEA